MHIPFCRQACNYCNFHFTTSLRYKSELVDALCREMVLQQSFLAGAPVQTVYFGGGTPSLLTGAELQRLLETLRATFPVAEGAEITLEANPDDISAPVLQGWKAAGINRLSIGIQSFIEEELRWMNRAHSAVQATRCIEESLAAGFSNFSIDLIYGSPLLTDARWQQNVEQAVRYNIPHLSCYALTVEEKTPLHKLIAGKQLQPTESEQQARQFLLLMQWLAAAGYEHYEVSNFARPGYRSRHNSSYWQGEKYLGLGPSAHSYDGAVRRWNVANNQQYIRSVQGGPAAHEQEVLTPVQKLNEYIMVSLRTGEGLDLDRLQLMGGAQSSTTVEKKLRPFLANGWVRQSGASVQLTQHGMLMADGIAADLFF